MSREMDMKLLEKERLPAEAEIRAKCGTCKKNITDP